MSKILASIISALLITVINTLYSEYQKIGEHNVGYYSVYSEFGMGFVVIFTFYLLIGIPLSMMADGYIRHRNIWVKLITYTLGGAAVGGVFPIINHSNSMSGALILVLYFGIAGLIFGIIQTFLQTLFPTIKKIL